MDRTEEWLTVQEVADKLRVKAFTVRRAIRSGKLKAARIGGQSGYRISPEAVQKYMEDRSKGEAPQEIPGRPAPVLAGNS